MAVSSDGSRIVSGGWDNLVIVWDANIARPTQSLRGHSKVVNSVAFSKGSNRVVSGADDKTVRLWDAATGKGFPAYLRATNHGLLQWLSRPTDFASSRVQQTAQLNSGTRKRVQTLVICNVRETSSR